VANIPTAADLDACLVGVNDGVCIIHFCVVTKLQATMCAAGACTGLSSGQLVAVVVARHSPPQPALRRWQCGKLVVGLHHSITCSAMGEVGGTGRPTPLLLHGLLRGSGCNPMSPNQRSKVWGAGTQTYHRSLASGHCTTGLGHSHA
jgi:hypothetical protein